MTAAVNPVVMRLLIMLPTATRDTFRALIIVSRRAYNCSTVPGIASQNISVTLEQVNSIKGLNDQIEQVKGGKDELMKKVEKEWLHTGVSIVLTLGTQSIT